MEFVFVVPRTELFPNSYPLGLTLFGEDFEEEAFVACVEEHGFFVERAYAERTPTLKQVIPYSLVTQNEQVFLMRRLSKGGESRLHNKLSIGVGGHINPVDLPAETDFSTRRNPVPAASRREVAEELHVRGNYEVRSVGILNDDTNAVGAVHVGLVQVITVVGSVEVRETDHLTGQFSTHSELLQLHEQGSNFETWSSLLLPHLDRLIPETVAPLTLPRAR